MIQFLKPNGVIPTQIALMRSKIGKATIAHALQIFPSSLETCRRRPAAATSRSEINNHSIATTIKATLGKPREFPRKTPGGNIKTTAGLRASQHIFMLGKSRTIELSCTQGNDAP